jgi:hypothetical protein
VRIPMAMLDMTNELNPGKRIKIDLTGNPLTGMTYEELMQLGDMGRTTGPKFTVPQLMKRLLKRLDLMAKAKQYKQLYEALGVSADASDDDIKRAYREFALTYHSDKWVEDRAKETGLSREAMDDKFKIVSALYEEFNNR